MAYVTRTHGERPHAKFQPPTMTGLAVHKGQTEGQNKGNANIYVDNVIVACFACSNVECDFWGDFQILCRCSCPKNRAKRLQR